VYNPSSPWKFRSGSFVPIKKDMSKAQKDNDSVLAILQPGEIVVSKKYVNNKLKKVLEENKVHVPNFTKKK
jgi:hypothetical protein